MATPLDLAPGNDSKEDTEGWLAIEDKVAAGDMSVIDRVIAKVDKSRDIAVHFKLIAEGFRAMREEDEGAPDRAEYFFRRAIEKAGHKSMTHRMKGLYHFRMGDFMEAYKCFEKARALNNEDPRAPYYLSCLLDFNTEHDRTHEYAVEAMGKCNTLENGQLAATIRKHIKGLEAKSGTSPVSRVNCSL